MNLPSGVVAVALVCTLACGTARGGEVPPGGETSGADGVGELPDETTTWEPIPTGPARAADGLPVTDDAKYAANGGQNGQNGATRYPYVVDGLIGCGEVPVDVALNSTLSHIYLVCRDAKTLCVLDTITRDVLKRVPLGGEGVSVVSDPYANKVYVSDSARAVVTVIDSVLLEVTTTIPVGGEPGRLAIDPEKRRLYVADGRAGTVRIVDCGKAAVVGEIDLAAAPSAMAADPGTGRLVIASRDGRTLTIVDLESRDDVKSLDLPARPGDVLIDPETGATFAALPATGKLMVVDQDKLVTVDIGTAPHSLAVDRGRGIVFVGDVEGRQVVLLDASSKEILQRVELAEVPVRLAYDSSDRSVYVVPDEGNHVRKLVVSRPKQEPGTTRRRRGPRLGTKIVGGLVGAVGAVFRKARGFAQLSVEDDEYANRKTRTVEEEVRMNLSGRIARGRVGHYSGNIGWKHADVELNGVDSEFDDLVYDLELVLLPKTRSGLKLRARRNVNDISSSSTAGRRLVTEKERVEWFLRPWQGGSVVLFWESMDAEDALDPAGYFVDAERCGARISQGIGTGDVLIDYEQVDRDSSEANLDGKTQFLDVRARAHPTQDLSVDLDYRYRDHDLTAGGDTESHIGILRAGYRPSDRLVARLDLRGDSYSADTSDREGRSALADVRYYPIRTPEDTWEISFLGRVHDTETDLPATTIDSSGGTGELFAEHRTRTPRLELWQTYAVGFDATDAADIDRQEAHERARIRAIYKTRDWCRLLGEGEFRFRQRDQAGERDLILDADLTAGVLLDIPRRLGVRAEVTTLFTTDPYLPDSDFTARIDAEWAAHDHRWDWGTDRFLVGVDISERLNRWTEKWYLRYEYRARLTKLSLTTLDVRREWRSDFGGDSDLTEVRFGFRYDINQLTMRLEWIYRDADGPLYRDRDYLMMRIRRTF
ncbi:MAG: YncE family protein [Planctomycetota bacterium]